jgi:arylsulfatase A-like enzyme
MQKIDAPHTADQDANGSIDLSELLRVIQFFTTGSFHCQDGTEDGFDPGTGDTDCGAHASDYRPQDWSVSLGELLRLIQFFNSAGYRPCVETEDGFCIGQNPPNVVYLLLDTLRSDRVGGTRNGVPITPFLDSMGEQGTRFTQAFAPSSWTRPSMISFFTGLYPDVFRGEEETPPAERFVIPESIETMPEWFSRNGYDTWGVQTNANGTAGFGFAQGFAEGRYEYFGIVPAAIVNQNVIKNIDAWQEPFFIYAQYMDPHEPYAPPTEYNEIFGPQPETTTGDELILSPQFYRTWLEDLVTAWVNGTEPTHEPLTENGAEALRYRYDADIRYMDDQLAELVAAIEAKYPNTIFVFVADHGEALLDRDIVGHGFSLYQEQAVVPLILRGPGVPLRSVEEPVEAIGTLPTLAKLMHVPVKPVWHGKDLLGPEATGAPAFCYTRTKDLEGASITDGDLKYIEHTRYPSPQLFNLEIDPGETTDLSVELSEDVARLADLLQAHQDALPLLKSGETAPLDDDIRDQLEAMGYLAAE